MPKMKTKKSAKKRFKITGTGKIVRGKANRRHLLAHKKRKRKRRLRSGDLVDKTDLKRVKSILPYA